VYGGQRQLAMAIARVVAPLIPQMTLTAVGRAPMSRQRFRPKDGFASAVAMSAPASTGAVGGVPAPVSNPLATMNHMRFECGVYVNALLKTSPKGLLKSLWASPDSPNVVSIGYAMLTTR
jgi:hypothetical protein